MLFKAKILQKAIYGNIPVFLFVAVPSAEEEAWKTSRYTKANAISVIKVNEICKLP